MMHKNKLETVIVLILALGIGVGFPLYIRSHQKDGQTSVLTGQNTQDSSENQPSVNSNDVSAICNANPPSVHTGEQVVWTVKTNNIPNADQITYVWVGAVTGIGQVLNATYDVPGTYNATVKFDGVDFGRHEATCTINVMAKDSQGQSTVSNSPSNSSNTFAPTPNSDQSSTNISPSTTAQNDQNPPADILSCTITNPSIVISQSQITMVSCKLRPTAIVTARIIKGDYLPPAEPEPSAIVKTFVYQKSIYDKTFSFNWNGIDAYDAVVPDGVYSFVATAQQNAESKPDISIQKIQVMQSVKNSDPQTQQTVSPDQNPSQPTATTPDDGGAKLNPADTSTTITTPISPSSTTASIPSSSQPKASKCHGVNYPTDIDNYPDKTSIQQAYDRCIFRGFADGTFHPEQTITRYEALKSTLIAAGIPPKYGCYDTDCGTPFQDLVFTESQWVRAAWDLKIIKGTAENLFMPQGAITRGDAAILLAKAFNIAPYQSCFTPNCGAGHPNNFFLDITNQDQGEYIRALWDKRVIHGTGPNIFDPDKPLTRGQMATLLIKIAQ